MKFDFAYLRTVQPTNRQTVRSNERSEAQSEEIIVLFAL